MDNSKRNKFTVNLYRGFPSGTCRRRYKRHRFYPWLGKVSWRRAWKLTPVFMPGESHGQRSLVGYSPYGRKESDVTERILQMKKLKIRKLRNLLNCSKHLLSSDDSLLWNRHTLIPSVSPKLFLMEKFKLHINW